MGGYPGAGDLVDNPSDPVQDSIFTTRLKEIEAPVYTLPGNHDYQGTEPENLQRYIALRGYERFSFKDHGCAFISLNANVIKDNVEDMEQAQLAWLEKELAAAAGCRYRFVFLHCPIVRESLDEDEDYFNFSKDKRRQYIDLLKKYKVDAVFAGHCHQQYSCEIEGIGFYTAGPVANAIGHGFPGFNVVNVGKDGIEVTYTASR